MVGQAVSFVAGPGAAASHALRGEPRTRTTAAAVSTHPGVGPDSPSGAATSAIGLAAGLSVAALAAARGHRRRQAHGRNGGSTARRFFGELFGEVFQDTECKEALQVSKKKQEEQFAAIMQLKAEKEELAAALAQAGDLGKLQQTIVALQKDQESAAALVQAKDVEKGKLEQKVAFLEQELTAGAARTMGAEQQRLKQKVALLEKDKAYLAKAKDAEREELEQKLALLENGQADILNQRTDTRSEVARLASTVVALQTEKSELQDGLARAESVSAELTGKLAAAQSRAEAISTGRKEMEAATAAALSDTERALMQREFMEKELTRLTGQVIATTDAKAELLGKVTALVQDMEQLLQTLQHTELAKLTAAAKKEIEKALAQRSSVAQEVARLTSQVALARSQVMPQLEVSQAAEEAAAAAASAAAEVARDPELERVLQAMAVMEWLRGQKLGVYYNLFKEKGYKSLVAIKAIEAEEVEDLVEFCSMPIGHERQFKRGLNRLKGETKAAARLVAGRPEPAAPSAARARSHSHAANNGGGAGRPHESPSRVGVPVP